MERSLRSWSGRPRSAGFLGGAVFVAGAAAALVFLALVAVLGLIVMALVGIVMAAERLVGLVVPAYRHRRRQRYLTMPVGLVRMVRFGSAGPTQVIEARSYEAPSEVLKR